MSYIKTAQGSFRRFERDARCAPDLNKAVALFHRFHAFPAPTAYRNRCQRLIPPVLVHLGFLKGLIYSSDKWDRGCPKTFIHFMETPPRLTCNPEGTQLFVIGGNYRITSRGIEG